MNGKNTINLKQTTLLKKIMKKIIRTINQTFDLKKKK